MTGRTPLFWFLLATVLSLPPVVHAVPSVLYPLYAPLRSIQRFAQDFATYRREVQQEAIRQSIQIPAPGKDLSDTLTHSPGVSLLELVDARPMGYPQELLLQGSFGNPGDLLLVGPFFAGRITQRRGPLLHGLTLYHPSVCVSARPKHSTAWGMLCGGRPPRLRFIPLYHPVQPGDTVLTAGVGEVPEGLLLGKILRVVPSEVDPGFWEAEIRPFLSYHSTRYYRVEEPER